MFNFKNLPDLIVLNIIHYIHQEFRFKQSLPLLSLCHNWRQLGIPVVYKTAYYWYTLDMDATSDFNNTAISLQTNLDLMRDTNVCNKPKKLSIEWRSSRMNGYKLLEPFYRIFNPNSTELGTFLLREFASHFSSITTLIIHDREYNDMDTILQRFAGELVSVFSNKLKTLELMGIFTMGLSHYPANLTKLSYFFRPIFYSPLPAIDPTALEMLRIFNIPSSNICTILEASVGAQKKVVFPNLVHLELCGCAYNINEVDDSIKKHIKSIECPKLETMDVLFNCDTSIDFSSLSTPAHMQKAYFSIETVAQLRSLSELPIMSIKSLTVMLMGLEFNDGFYQATNYLFSKIKTSKELKVSIFSGDGNEKLHYERLRWANVTSLMIDNVGINDVFSIVSKLPKLDTLGTSYMSSTQETLPLIDVHNNKVKTMDIESFDMRDPLEIQAACVVDIAKILTGLTRIGLPDDLKTLVAGKINENKYKYPHFAQIEISDFRFVG